MRKVLIFSTLLLLGLIGSQWLPGAIGPSYGKFGDVVRVLTMVGLSFIMIRVGYEFDIDKSNLKQYGWDYVVAFTAASFPWILVSLYFVFVLLPADLWGSMAYPLRHPGEASAKTNGSHGHEVIDTPTEKRVATTVAAAFMVLVGLSMPMILSGESAIQGGAMIGQYETTLHGAGVPAAEKLAAEIGSSQQIGRITAAQPQVGWAQLILHVLAVTVISNVGKLFPIFCYRKEAHWRERLAVAVGMWPRGEVGAGVLVISLSYGIGGPIVTIAMLSLALNLMLTGIFIYIVKRLTASLPAYGANSEGKHAA